MQEKHASDSLEQREAEKLVIKLLEQELKFKLDNDVLLLNDKIKVQIDGYNLDKKVIIEVYSGVGSLKPGQIKKVMTDAFKLLFVEKELFKNGQCRKILCFIDKEIRKHFKSDNWQSKALKTLGIEVIHIELSYESTEKLKSAKIRQGNTMIKQSDISPQ